MERIIVEHNMAIEFITTIMRCVEPNHFEDYISEHEFLSNKEISDIIDGFRTRLTSFERSNLEILFLRFRLNFYYLIMFVTDKGITNVDELILELENTSGEIYLENCFRICSADISIQDSDIKVLDLISKNYSTSSAEVFVEFKNEPTVHMNQLITSLKIFYEKYFKAKENYIRESVQPILDRHNDFIKSERNTFINTIWNGDYLKVIESVNPSKIYISYLGEFIPRYLHDNNMHSFVYGYSEDQKLKKREVSKRAREIFKTLSDDTRLKILYLLAQKKWKRNDLVKEIGLTSATMTYQLNKLLSLGLITMTAYEGEKKVRYSIDKDNFKSMIDKSIDELIF